MGILSVILKLRFFQILSVFFLFLSSFFTTSNGFPEGVVYRNCAKFGVFYSLQTLLDSLEQEKYHDNPTVRSLLTTFDNHCRPREGARPLRKKRQYPFIVVEGSQRTSRRILSRMLAKSLGAKLVNITPRCLLHLRHQFDDDVELKRMFFSISMYITAFNIRHMLEEMPVVLAGYWMDQATFNLAKEFPQDLPPAQSILYQFPPDLLVPDLIFYLNSRKEEYKLTPEVVEFNNRVVDVYRHMRNPGVYELNSSVVSEPVVLQLRREIKKQLASKFDHLNL